MKQFRDTNYWVDNEGNIYRFRDEWSREYNIINSNGKPYIKKRYRPAYYRKLKPCIANNGYYAICIDKRRSAHRVIAECYLGPCPIGYEVDHIDGNKLNNHPTNLQYLTKEENILKSPKNWKLLSS